MDTPALQYIGRYRIVRRLGEGGMGVVYECIDEKIGRRVAIKKLHPEYARQTDVVARFFNEARAANLVSHPAIVQISELITDSDGSAYLVMEFLAGETLSQRIVQRGGKLSEPEALQIIWQLASALDATHSHNIVHRDLKPGNVMIIPDPTMPEGERVKLLDFGIAKLGNRGADHAQRTRTGVIMGTPAYMSPEQCCGAALVDSKSDVYSLGIMTFELLTGEVPFRAEHELAVLHMHVAQAAPPLGTLVLGGSTALAELVAQLLQKSPAARPSMAMVEASVKRLLRVYSSQAQSPTQASAPPSAGNSHTTIVQSVGQIHGIRSMLPRYRVYGLLVFTIIAVGAIGDFSFSRTPWLGHNGDSASVPNESKKRQSTRPVANIVATDFPNQKSDTTIPLGHNRKWYQIGPDLGGFELNETRTQQFLHPALSIDERTAAARVGQASRGGPEPSQERRAVPAEPAGDARTSATGEKSKKALGGQRGNAQTTGRRESRSSTSPSTNVMMQRTIYDQKRIAD